MNPEIYGTATLADVEESVAKTVADAWLARGRRTAREVQGELIQTIQDNYETEPGPS
ncbi:hypothetical protein LV779_19195 [Streptomyces thinghirensis]|nr:hypothetical protein [Streptomyces thinghirensis]